MRNNKKEDRGNGATVINGVDPSEKTPNAHSSQPQLASGLFKEVSVLLNDVKRC